MAKCSHLIVFAILSRAHADSSMAALVAKFDHENLLKNDVDNQLRNDNAPGFLARAYDAAQGLDQSDRNVELFTESPASSHNVKQIEEIQSDAMKALSSVNADAATKDRPSEVLGKADAYQRKVLIPDQKMPETEALSEVSATADTRHSVSELPGKADAFQHSLSSLDQKMPETDAQYHKAMQTNAQYHKAMHKLYEVYQSDERKMADEEKKVDLAFQHMDSNARTAMAKSDISAAKSEQLQKQFKDLFDKADKVEHKVTRQAVDVAFTVGRTASMGATRQDAGCPPETPNCSKQWVLLYE